VVRVSFDLPSNPVHELLEELAIASASSPDMSVESLRADHMPRMGEEELKEAELKSRQLHCGCIAHDEELILDIEPHSTGNLLRKGVHPGSTQERSHPREQRLRAERLRHVVIGPKVEAAD
jgi:hypothetical protein